MHCVRWVVIARQSIPLLRTWWQSTAGGVNIVRPHQAFHFMPSVPRSVIPRIA